MCLGLRVTAAPLRIKGKRGEEPQKDFQGVRNDTDFVRASEEFGPCGVQLHVGHPPLGSRRTPVVLEPRELFSKGFHRLKDEWR